MKAASSASVRSRQPRRPRKGAPGASASPPPAAAGSSRRRTSPAADGALRGVVGVGASAGGLAALETLFRRAQPGTGLAFLVTQHHAPNRPTLLVDLIAVHTRLRVIEAVKGAAPEPDTVYVCPAGRILTIVGGRMRVHTGRGRERLRPIDALFGSIARTYGPQGTCVVLSGTGSDGTAGAQTLAARGGLVVAQTPASAGCAAMPQSTINASGSVEVLAPEDILPFLIERRADAWRGAGYGLKPKDVRDAIEALARKCGHDFSLYKQNTIVRRIERRMTRHRLADGAAYVRMLREDTAEARELFRELLIDVTSFFRDPDAFRALRRKALPTLLANRDASAPLRVWVPGCSTGEEAYSLAMCIRMAMDGLSRTGEVKIFATDVSAKAIDVARRGIYPEDALAAVPAAFRRTYFIRHGAGHRVREEIREMMVFSVQDVTKDPPFSRLDLISCRNLLIYMQPGLQRRVLPLFHDSLNDGGILFLGGSESLGGFSDRFKVLDRKWKLYQRKVTPGVRRPLRAFPSLAPGRPDAQTPHTVADKGRMTYREAIEKVLVEHFAPVALLVDEKGEILHVHGRTGPYLEAVSGRASLNVLNLAREGLRIDLGMALRKVFQKQVEVRCPGLRVRTNGSSELVDLTVRRMPDPAGSQALAIVVFQPVHAVPDETPAHSSKALDRSRRRIDQLSEELRGVRSELRRTTEESDAAREELEATNEELQSTNEELQSTNEELETAKEELQSVNEELSGANVQLEEKIAELQRANSDLQNLMASTDIGVLFLDLDCCIRRFTPDVRRVIDLVDTDVGRPIESFAPRLAYETFLGDVRRVLDSLQTVERVVRSDTGQWFLVHMKPYRTIRNAVDGVVIGFMDVTRIRREQSGRQLMASAAQASDRATLVIGPDGCVEDANAAAARCLAMPPSEMVGKPLASIVCQPDKAAVQRAVEACLRQSEGDGAHDGSTLNVTIGPHHWSALLRRLTDDQGVVIGACVVLTPLDG